MTTYIDDDIVYSNTEEENFEKKLGKNYIYSGTVPAVKMFIKSFALIAKPLVNVLKKDVNYEISLNEDQA